MIRRLQQAEDGTILAGYGILVVALTFLSRLPLPLALEYMLLSAPLIPIAHWSRRRTVWMAVGIFVLGMAASVLLHRTYVDILWSAAATVCAVLLFVLYTHRSAARQRELNHHLESASRLPEENPEPIYSLTLDGRILYANPIGREHLMELSGRADCCPQIWREALKTAVAAKQISTLEYRADDGRRTYYARFVPTNQVVETHTVGRSGANAAAPEAPEAVTVYVHDVTDRVDAEHAALEQKSLIHDVLDTSPNYIFVKDADGNYLLCNEGFARFFGVTTEEVIGGTGRDFLWDANLNEAYLEEDRQTLQRGAEIVIPPQKVEDAAGNAHWVQTIKRPIRSADGEHHYILGVTTDITDLHLAAEAIKNSDRLFRAVSEAISHLLISPDLDAAMEKALSTVGRAADVDEVFIYQESSPDTALLRYRWERSAQEPGYNPDTARDLYARIPITPELARWHQRLRSGELILATTETVVDAVSDTVDTEWSPSSLLLSPIFVAGEFWGIIGYEDWNLARNWSEGITASVQTLAGGIGGAIGWQRAQEELKQQQSFTRTIIDNLPLLVFVKDHEFRYEMVNRQFGEVYGVVPSEIIGQRYGDVIGPDGDAADSLAEDQSVLSTAQDVTVPFAAIPTAAGEERYFQFLKRPIHDEEGRFRYLLGIGLDITERHKAEAALREERNLLRTLIDNIPDYIYIKDRESRIVLANQAHVKLLGADNVDALLGKQDFDFFPTESTMPFYRKEQQIITTGQAVVDRVERGYHNTRGVHIWLLESKVPWFDTDGRVRGIVGISRDISDMKRVETDLREAKEAAEIANRVKSEFLANMSHEIRTPLNAMIGMTSLLLDSTLTDQQYDFVETIRTSGDTLLSILNDVLDFSKIEAGMLELEQQPFSLNQCIESTIELSAREASQKGIDLLYTVADDVSDVVIGDVTRLRQVLVNLVSNAVKFTEQGEVVVEVTRQSQLDDTLHFTVRDTGIGIPSERIEHIFDAFSQVDASTTRRFGGTGLGLAISRQLVGIMGGVISVESIVGRGTAFHFTAILPGDPFRAESTPTGALQATGQNQEPQHAGLHSEGRQSDSDPAADVPLHELSRLTAKRALLAMQAGRARDILVQLLERWGLDVIVWDGADAAASGVWSSDPADGVAPDILRAGVSDVTLDVILVDDSIALEEGLLTNQGRPAGETSGVEADETHNGQGGTASGGTAAVAPPVIRLVRMGGSLNQGSGQTGETDLILYKPFKRSVLLDALNNAVDENPTERSPVKRTRPSLFEKAQELDPSLHILLAEDNLVNQKVAVRILERLGLNADVASDGSEAVDAVMRQRYDVILMDAHMPIMDGLEATRRIRAQVPADRQPYIIAMTADALEQVRQACLDAGMDDFVAKPVRINELIKALRAAGAARARQHMLPHTGSRPDTTSAPRDDRR